MNSHLAHQNNPAIPKIPHVFREFRHVLHHWNSRHQSHMAHILPGQFYVSASPILITTIVGSCVTVCIFDKKIKIGGMNHFMLPINNSAENTSTPFGQEVTRYGDSAMEYLIHSLVKHGAHKEDFEVKIFGGGKILHAMPDIGGQNIEFILHYIQMENLNLINQDVGGKLPRRIIFSPISGRARVRKLHGHHDQRIALREEHYLHNIQEYPEYNPVALLKEVPHE